MSRRARRIWAIALGCAVGLAAIAWVFVDVTARRSGFCSSCHYMEPYVEQWANSAHREVECVRCHPTERRAMLAQFVKYATGTYAPRPRAFVPDGACAGEGCHPDMAGDAGTPFLTVTFPHAPHLREDRRGIRLHCASCHGASEEAGHVSVDERVCYLCHFKGQADEGTLGRCGACHGAPAGPTEHGGFLFDMKAYVDSGVQCSRCHLSVHDGDGAVPRDKCYSCHLSRLERLGDTRALHKEHVGRREVACLSCHDPIRHGNVKLLSVMDVACESCHQNLHAGPKEMYLGVGARRVASTPSRMFAAQINCTGCHTQVVTQGGISFLGEGSKGADPRACAACHDARYAPMVERWKTQGRALAEGASRLSAEAQRLAAGSQDAGKRALAEDAAFNARFLQQGHPVHNIEYAVKVLQANAAIVKELGGAPAAPAFAGDAFAYCQESCHTFIPRPDPLDFMGVDFPHAYHVREAGLSCDTCHAAGRHKVMALESPSDCTPCHHGGAAADCVRCHPRQSALYRGELPTALGISAGPDPMAEAVGCSDCHDPEQSDALEKMPETCAGCHDEQGKKDLEAWRSSEAAAEKRLARLSDEASLALDSMGRAGRDAAKLKKRFDGVQTRLEYLRKAGFQHNPRAATAEYARAEAELQSLLDETLRARDGR